MPTSAPPRSIVKRDGNVVPYDRDRIATVLFKAEASVGAEDRARCEQLALQVEEALVETYGSDATPSVEDIQDVVEATLMKNGRIETARKYIIYRNQRAEARALRAERFEITDNIPYKKIYEILRWNMDHQCATLADLNRIIAGGGFPDLIAACDRRYHEEVESGARKILERVPEVRIVIIAGPSSSGKTTTTIKAGEVLRRAGLELVALTVDNYFFDLDHHPKDEFGDYDYETPEALDLALINEHLERLLRGETVRTPSYDFKTGKRRLDAIPMRLEKNQIVLIDSLHGLYGDMTRSIPAAAKFRLFIETLGQVRTPEGVFMRWADNRLMRRMMRDSWHRNLQPMETLTHWHYVRRSELRHIIPFIGSVDYIVNSAMPYELPILKAKLFRYFPEAMQRFQADPKRQDAYIRAKRVSEFLAPLTAVEDDACVPATSLIREFIGGSAYTY